MVVSPELELPYCCCSVISHVHLSVTPWTAAYLASLSFTISWSLLNSYPLSWWCRPAISSCDALFSFCPQSFPASGTFPMSCLSASDDQNTGPSASASALPVNIQGWFPLRLTGLISLLFKGLSESSSAPQFEGIILWCSAFFTVQLSQPCMTTGKAIALTIRTFVGTVMSLLFNTLSRFVITFLPRSNCLLISWLQSPFCGDFGAQEEEICHCFHLFPFYLPCSNGIKCHDLIFFNV